MPRTQLWLRSNKKPLRWLAFWLGLAVVLTVIFLAGQHYSATTADRLYENQVALCRRENPERRDIHNLTARLAYSAKEKARVQKGFEKQITIEAGETYHQIARDLTAQNFARPNGTINCAQATPKP